MKFIIIVFVAAIVAAMPTSTKAGWFGDSGKTEVINDLREQVHQERSRAGVWQIVASVLGVGCVITLVVGAAIGSGRRRHERAGE